MISSIKDWFDRIFFSKEVLGDKLFNILVGIFAIMFVVGWALFAIWFLYESIFDFLKWLKKKNEIPNFEYEEKLDDIKKKIDRLILIPLSLPLYIIPRSLIKKGNHYKYQIRLAKSIVFGISTPALFVIIWLSSSSSPLQELKLILTSEIVEGKIVAAVENSDVIELYEGRKTEQVFYYDYEYVYRVSDNVLRHARASELGKLPAALSFINLPAYVEIEYIPNDPDISRVRGMKSNSTTIFEWTRKRIILPGLIFLFVCFLCGKSIHSEYKKYKAGIIETDLI